MKWYALFFLAIVIEAVITYARTLLVDRQFQWQIAAAMLLGVGCALAFGVDLFAVAGVPAAVPYAGQVLTGVLLSRGSNYAFDLFGKLTNAQWELSSAGAADIQRGVDVREEKGQDRIQG